MKKNIYYRNYPYNADRFSVEITLLGSTANERQT